MIRAALVILVAMLGTARAEHFDPLAIYKVPRGHAPATGAADAAVTIVEFSDYACGYCNKVQAALDHLERLYPGQLRWVHRTMPLDEDNTLLNEAALAADAQGRFLPMNDRLFAIGGRADRATIELIARELGLDMVRFRADLDTRAFRPAIDADIADARALGIEGTPTFFINGRAVFGNQPLQVFVDVVDQELSRAAGAHAGYDALVAGGRARADAPDKVSLQRALVATRTYRMGLGLPGHQLGPDDALVTVVVWSDFQCPFCAKEAPVLTHLRDKYKDEIRIVYRHLAMGFHRDASLAAEAAVAAAEQGKFWAFHDQVFGDFGHLARADLERFAQAAGLELVAFRAALDSRRYRDTVVAEGAAAEALGVDGTPTMFINGAPVIGARAPGVLDPLIDAHLARSRQVVASGNIAASELYAMLMTAGAGDDRADPSRVPAVRSVPVAPRSDDRVRSVAAACRRRDGARAKELIAPLEGTARRRALAVCTGAGIDLP